MLNPDDAVRVQRRGQMYKDGVSVYYLIDWGGDSAIATSPSRKSKEAKLG